MIINKFQYKYFRTMSVAPQTSVSDTEFNTEKIIEAMEIADSKSVDLLLFPELSITSYSCGITLWGLNKETK